MKHFKYPLYFLLTLAFFTQACISPSDPEGLKSEHVITIDTIGYCKDFDLNDTLLVLAANENGYMVFEYEFDAQGQFHYEFIYDDNDMDNDGSGVDKISSVQISEQFPLLYLMDHSDGVYYTNIGMPDDDLATGKLGGGLSENRDIVRSMILDDSRPDQPILYSLRKPGSAENYTEINARYLSAFGENPMFVFENDTPSWGILNEAAESICLADSLMSVTLSELGVAVYRQQADGSLVEFTAFDTPGIAQTVYSVGQRIFAGLDEDFGCYTALLDSVGNIDHTFNIAEGYSVRSIHYNDGILALACGNDGVLLFEWSGTDSDHTFEELGWLESAYAYRAHVYDSQKIFVATRSGLQLFNLEN